MTSLLASRYSCRNANSLLSMIQRSRSTHVSRPSSIIQSTPRDAFWRSRSLLTVTGLGLGLSVGLATQPKIFCATDSELSPSTSPVASSPDSSIKAGSPVPTPPKTLSTYELTFGTVAGICAGVFVKKGAKLVAFTLGGIFVVLQYFGSLSSVARVNWTTVGHGFERLFYSTDAQGQKQAPTLLSVFNGFINFLTADFPPRASFVAGFVLGLRVG